MRGTRLVHCTCCGLEQRARVDDAGNPASVRCLRCAAHDGEGIDQPTRREADHAQLYRRALVDAQDDVVLARTESAFCRDKMTAAYSTRELLVKVLCTIDAEHHYRGNRCSCGRRGCRVVRLLADPRVAGLVRGYDEEKRALRELRNANPDLWTEVWDCIDVTLVYPKPTRRSGVGRHRAAH